MSNRLSNHDSAQHSQGGKQLPAVPLDDGANEEIFIDENSIAPHQVFDNDSEMDNEPPNTDEFEAAAAAELTMAKRREHALRRIEARWEESRLNDLLREVYDEE
jgi:hypothetical protein